MKQYCPKNHDTFVVGRNKDHYCKQCETEYVMSKETKRKRNISQKRWHLNNSEKTKATFIRCYLKKKQEREDFLNKFKNRPCQDCWGWFEPCQMDFDHRNPIEKVNSISKMGWDSVSLQKIKLEIQKCDLVCANCHRLRTRKQYQIS